MIHLLYFSIIDFLIISTRERAWKVRKRKKLIKLKKFLMNFAYADWATTVSQQERVTQLSPVRYFPAIQLQNGAFTHRRSHAHINTRVHIDTLLIVRVCTRYINSANRLTVAIILFPGNSWTTLFVDNSNIYLKNSVTWLCKSYSVLLLSSTMLLQHTLMTN